MLAETAHVRKPGGVYLYDTINRTRRNGLVVIKLMQEWRATALMEPDLHDWEMFIKPGELAAALARVGLENQETVGLGPARNPLAMLVDMRRRARGVTCRSVSSRRGTGSARPATPRCSTPGMR